MGKIDWTCTGPKGHPWFLLLLLNEYTRGFGWWRAKTVILLLTLHLTEKTIRKYFTFPPPFRPLFGINSLTHCPLAAAISLKKEENIREESHSNLRKIKLPTQKEWPTQNKVTYARLYYLRKIILTTQNEITYGK